MKKAETNGSLMTTTVYVGSHYETPTISPNSDIPWWNPRWASRTVLTATNQMASALAAGYSLKLSLSGSAANSVYTKSITEASPPRMANTNTRIHRSLRIRIDL